MKLNDDDQVAWTAKGQRTTSTVGVLRAAWRPAYPDWSDDQLEQELFKLLIVKGETQ